MGTKVTRRYFPTISEVLVYRGHEKNPIFGPHFQNIQKRIEMYQHLNHYRTAYQLPPWNITTVSGEELEDALQQKKPEDTLLVITSGQSSNLDKVFTQSQLDNMNKFFSHGGRGYFTCGSSYWATRKRIYHDICEQSPDLRKTIVKTSRIPLLQMIAEGPLCPHPGAQYRIGFYTEAVRVISNDKEECTVYLSGGGSFRFPEEKKSQKISVLVRYVHSELERFGKKRRECKTLENAVVMASIGERGAAIFSMFHPYYNANDIDVERYERAFPHSGTNWRDVKARLTPTPLRMHFVFKSMLDKLDRGDFEEGH
jgi:glutamine amidotransferase-like uncharacterized protein